MFDCTYFKKTEFDHKSLVGKLDDQDTKKIAAKMGISYTMAQKYSSREKKHLDVRVPQFFIDVASDIISERKRSQEEVNQKIKAI